MNRIDQLFAQVRARRRPALAAYITAGDPGFAQTREIALALAEAGVELIEFGVPFSDPIADGPVIQRAAQRSLAAGTTVDGVLGCLRSIRAAGCEAAVSLFGAYNPFLHRGLDTICREAKESGADGFLIPDLPADEAEELRPHLEKHDLRCAYLLAPTSSAERIRLVTEASSGYVYCVALRGVTGERAELPPDLAEFLARARAATDKPLLVGFGISKPEHVATLAPLVDAIVVGSAFVRIIEEHGKAPDLAERVAAFARSLRAAMG